MPRVLQSSPVSEMTLEAALSMGSEAWDQLALAHPFASVFMSWAWHQAWLEGSPTRDIDTAAVLTDFTPGSGLLPTVIFPLAYRRRSFYRCPVPALGWCAADVGTPDHLDILAVEGTDWANGVVDLLDQRSWNLLVLTSLEEGFPRSRRLLGALEAKGCHTRIERAWPCAQIHLPDKWETYLEGLSGKRRYRIRKDENQLRANHNVRVREFDLGQ